MRAAAVIAVTVMLLGAACTSGPSPGDGSSPGLLPSPGAINAAKAPLLPTDRYELPDFDPGKLDALLHQLRGTPLVVNVWGSWCGPCRKEAPDLARAALRYGRRVQFLGVDVMEESFGGREGARTFIRDAGWSYPSVYDPSMTGELRSALGFLGQPETIFYAASGKRVAVLTGASSFDEIVAGIRRILG
jgi:thiol-disulfide isomerase/thioredoxin